MVMTLNKIEVVTDFKHLQIREVTDEGGFHRRGASVLIQTDHTVESAISAFYGLLSFAVACNVSFSFVIPKEFEITLSLHNIFWLYHALL